MNDLQRKAAEAPNGYVQVLAGPGTGKTVTLVNRACELLSRGVDPSKLIIMSFTRAASHEIRERIARKINDPTITRKVVVGTFHSIAIRMIRRFTPANEKRIGIANDNEKELVINQLIEEFGWSVDVPSFLSDWLPNPPKTPPALKRELAKVISVFQQEVSNEKYDNTAKLNELKSYPQKLQKFVSAYLDRMKQLDRVDFDGLLVKFYEMLKSPIGPQIQSQAEAILVDEFQDTSTLQLLSTLELASKCGNLTVVGDPDQSIYGFRNANPRNFQVMMDILPDCLTRYLEDNYRSEQPILDVALNVIRSQPRFASDRALKARGRNKYATPVQMLKCFDGSVSNSVEVVCKQVETLIQAGVKPSEICVLSRSSTSFPTYEARFLSRNIPLRLVGGKKHLTEPKVMATICFIRICLDATDSLAIQQSLHYAKPSPKNLKLGSYMENGALTLGILEKYSSSLKQFKSFLELVKSFKNTLNTLMCQTENRVWNSQEVENPSASILKSFIREISNLTGADCGILFDTVDQFEEVCKDEESPLLRGTNPENTLLFIEEYVKLWALGPSNSISDEVSEDVTLSTIHSAKGLEWPVVFVVGYGETALSMHSDELRLFYVALTRAKSLLVLPTYSQLLVKLLTADSKTFLQPNISINTAALGDCVNRKIKSIAPPDANPKTKKTNMGTLQIFDDFQFASDIKFSPEAPKSVNKTKPTYSSVSKPPGVQKREKAISQQKSITSFFTQKK